MSMRDYDPRGEMLSLREAMNRLLEDSFVTSPVRSSLGALQMPLDVYESREAVVVRTSMPGVKPDDIDITVTGDTLTIRGELPEHRAGNDVRYHQREHRSGAFARSITLPVEVQPDKVEATFEHGVLTLTMPKAERMRPKQIKITARGGATPIDAQGAQGGTPAIEGQVTQDAGATAGGMQSGPAAGSPNESTAGPARSGSTGKTSSRSRKKNAS